MNVCVNYNDARWRKYKIDFARIANAALVSAHPDTEVSIVLTNDVEIHALNKKYRGIDAPTNVLSFELDDDILLGDIYISLDTVMREAKSEKISVADHTAHMVVHGMLHLQGYDHIKDDEAEIMENKEIKILKNLNIKNPYVQEYGACSDSECCPGEKFLSRLRKIKLRDGGPGQCVLMFVLGAIAAFGFAPFNMWWATLIAVALAYKLSVCGENKVSMWRAILRAASFGAAYAMMMFWWVLHSIYVVPELAAQFSIWTVPALIGIGVLGAIVFSVPFIVISRICTFPACRPFLFAAIWTLVLWLREWLFTGFPWNPIANIAMPWGMLANSMSLWGALGLTFIIIGGIASTVEIIKKRRDKSCWITFFIFVILGVIGLIVGNKNIELSGNGNNASPIIRVVQPARSAAQKASHSREEAMQNAVANIRSLMDLASAPGNSDLIVFPETSYPFVIVDGDNISLADALDKNIILGATSYSNDNIFNSMAIVLPNGDIQKIYSKSHLVPFGEYRPFGDIIPTPGQLTPGSGPEIISVNINGNDFAFAPAICYEIIFSDSLVPANSTPDAIINITNDTWFGKTPGTYQHLDMVRRYAIESGLPIVRANYSGISAFINPDGTIASMIPIGRAGYADGVVSGAHETIYRLIGRDGWMIIILAFSCACVLIIYWTKAYK